MPSLVYLRHVSTLFAALLAVSVLYGLARAAERGLSTNRRVSRALWTPVFFFVLFMIAAHAASFAPASSRFAMALAVLLPAHREKVARKLRPSVLAETKTDALVLGLVELDRLALGCTEALADAAVLRAGAGAEGAWARLDAVCGPSVGSAIAAYHQGRLADAVATFTAARTRSASSAKASAAELSSLLLLDRRREALALVRSETRAPGPEADALGCLEDALALYADDRSGPVRRALEAACGELGATFAGERSVPEAPKPLCTRHPRPRSAPPCEHGCFVSPLPDPIAALRDVAGPHAIGQERRAKAEWLVRAGRGGDASPLLDAELVALGTREPLYPATLVAEREAFFNRLGEDAPGSVVIEEDCTTAVSLPAGDARAKEARAFAVRFDERRDRADRGRLAVRDQVLARAATAALDAGDLARAEAYLAQRTSAPTRSSTLALQHAFSSDEARAALYGREYEAHASAAAGDGAAIVNALRAISGSGVGTIDVVGATVPRGRADLRAYSRHEARLVCCEGIDTVDDCGPGALVVALAGRARVAHAIGDDRTAKESNEAIDLLLGAPVRWADEPRVFALTRAAQRILRAEGSGVGGGL